MFLILYNNILIKIFLYFILIYILGIGDWGLGIGDWGLGIGEWGLGPIPNPQSPIPNLNIIINIFYIHMYKFNNLSILNTFLIQN